MIDGSCCCGSVKFTLSEKPSMMGTCHCSRCRKVGASMMMFVKKESLTITTGKQFITTFVPEKPYQYQRCFCKICGTALGEILSHEASFPIAAHTIDTPLNIKNQFHEFVCEKPSWYSIGDRAKQFDGHPQ